MIKKTLMLIISSLIVLTSCVPFPQCDPQKGTCLILSESETIHIPFILPITSQSQAMIQEQENVIFTTYQEVFEENKNFSLEFYDNLNSTIKNNSLILSMVESPAYPIIFNEIYPHEYQPHTETQPQYPTIAIPNNQEIIQQALDYLNDINAESSMLLTSYSVFEQIKSSDYCTNKNHPCFLFDEFNHNDDLRYSLNSIETIVLAGNSNERLTWINDFPFGKEKSIILLDTDLKSPQPIQIDDRQIYWIVPFKTDQLKNAGTIDIFQEGFHWDYFLSEVTIDYCTKAFSTIRENTNETKQGFRIIYQEELYQALTTGLEPLPFTFRLYQFNGTQFIMKDIK